MLFTTRVYTCALLFVWKIQERSQEERIVPERGRFVNRRSKSRFSREETDGARSINTRCCRLTRRARVLRERDCTLVRFEGEARGANISKRPSTTFHKTPLFLSIALARRSAAINAARRQTPPAHLSSPRISHSKPEVEARRDPDRKKPGIIQIAILVTAGRRVLRYARKFYESSREKERKVMTEHLVWNENDSFVTSCNITFVTCCCQAR